MEVPRHWRLQAQRYRLEGTFCPTCGQVAFPPRPVCSHQDIQAAQTTGWRLTELPASKLTFEPVPLKGE